MSGKGEDFSLSDAEMDRIRELWSNPRGISIRIDDKSDDLGSVDLSTKTLTVDPSNVKEALGESHLETIISEGVGNFALCPYDLKTAIQLEYLAYIAAGDKEKARFVRNAFGNIVLKSYMHEQGDKTMKEKIVDLISKSIDGSSKSGKFSLRFFEKQLGISESTLVPKESIDDAIEEDSSIMRSFFIDKPYSAERWKQSIGRFADILLKYDEKKKSAGSCGEGKDGKNGGGIAGELDVRLGENKEAIADALGEIAKEMEREEFKKLAAGLELGNKKYADLIFYRSRSERCRVHLPRLLVKSGELYPSTPTTWETCDEVSSLDVQYSLARHGILIPGETTHKWAFEEAAGFKLKHENPDLLLALDSSGSMKDPSKETSRAVLSAMAAKSSALARGSKVAVLNFSVDCRVVDYSSDESELDNALMLYYRGGTSFPSDKLLGIVKGNARKQHIIMITDAELGNFDKSLKDLEKAVKEYGATGSVFLIDNNTKGYRAAFEKIGFCFFPVKKEEDLLDLVIEDVKSAYEK